MKKRAPQQRKEKTEKGGVPAAQPRKKKAKGFDLYPKHSLFDFSMKHGDRFVKFSQVADRPPEIAHVVVPLGEEVTRHWNVNHLRGALDKVVKEAGGPEAAAKVPKHVYEMWLHSCSLDPSFHTLGGTLADFDMDQEKTLKQDPLIPMVELGMDQLKSLLSSLDVPEDKLEAILEAFQPELKNCVKALHVAMMKDVSKRVPVEIESGPDSLTVGRVKVMLQPAYRLKLETLYRRFGDAEGARFEEALAVMLVRYDALKGALFQSSLPARAFEVLRTHLGVFMECFASPLNCYFPRYCSLFPDCDFAFGAMGSFFHFRPQDGSFVAFPPQVTAVVEATLEHIESVLLLSSKALSFVLVLHGKDSFHSSWSTSQFYRNHVELAAKEHVLAEGLAFRTANRLHMGLCATQVVLLQNEAGHKRWPLTPTIANKIREAFGAAATPVEAAPSKQPIVKPPTSNWQALQKQLKKQKKKK